MSSQSQVVEEFRIRRKRQWLAAVPGIGAVVLLWVVIGESESTVLGVSSDHHRG